MIMKDKLVKTNHKGSYYLMKKVLIAFASVLTFAFVIAVPTYIIQNSRKKTNALAEEKSSEVIEENNSEENSEYESYSD